MTDNGERRTNHALRRRIDKLIGRVHAAREEIVERGLDAVHDPHERADGAADEDADGPPDAGTATAGP